VSAERPRARPIDVTAWHDVTPAPEGESEAALLGRLEDALAALPEPERAAAVAAVAQAGGAEAVAETLHLPLEDAEALARSAVQLLRGALAGADADPVPVHPEMRRRRRHRPG
jgi:DNA-directed RNA polymerase specialized sigma24 family protein